VKHLLAGLALVAALMSQSAMAMMVSTYTWSGPANWRAFGEVRFDEAVANPTARGSGVGNYSTGIEYLDLTLVNSAGVNVGYWVQIDNFVPQYPSLKVTLDSAAMAFAFGVMFEAGSLEGQRNSYFAVKPGIEAIIQWNKKLGDKGPAGTMPLAAAVNVPIPSTLLSVLLGLTVLGWMQARTQRGWVYA